MGKLLCLTTYCLLGHSAIASCQKLKLNSSDEILFSKNCHNICVLKALSHQAREYILVSDLSGTRIKPQLFYFDQSNTLQNSYTEGSDFFKIYSSERSKPYVANIIKYDKVTKALEIIELNSQKLEAQKHATFTCSK